MTNQFAGWALGLTALFMMLGLMAADIKSLHTWAEMVTPTFLGNMMAHISTVGVAFLGGKMIPTSPQNQREGDK